MRWRRQFACTTLALGLFAVAGAAQEWAAGPAVARVVERLRPGARVQVAEGGRLHRGTVARTDAAELVVKEGEAESTIPLTGVDSLWVGRSAAGGAALMGGVLGLAAGAIVGFVACSDCVDTPSEGVAAAGAAAGALGGALIGAAIGSGKTDWVRRDPE
jgi:hypothetical protein